MNTPKQTNSTLSSFCNGEFDSLETVYINNEIYFPALECAAKLGYKHFETVIYTHCRDLVKHKCPDTLGRYQNKNYISKRDVARLIIKSKLPAVKELDVYLFNGKNPDISNTEFKNVRTAEIGGQLYVYGADIARILGYKKPNNAVLHHCRHIVHQEVPHPQSPYGKNITVDFIPMCDVLRLAARSKLPAAKKFESWILDEILSSEKS
jgi:prophage antirepressor-like protein